MEDASVPSTSSVQTFPKSSTPKPGQSNLHSTLDETPIPQVPSTSTAPDAIPLPDTPSNNRSTANNTTILNNTGLTRHRQKHEDQWKRNISKVNRQSGKSYTSQKTGNVVAAKTIDYSKNCDPVKCKLKCQRKISKQQQADIFRQFWALGSDIKQKSFYDKTITELKSNQRDRSDFKGKRSISRKFMYHVDGRDVDVCQQFYLATLNISKSRINTYTRTKDEHGNPGERQSSEPWNKTQAALKQKAREHIASIPRIKSHYVRAASNKDYVDSTLNICKLYRLYKEWCINEKVTPVSEYVYSDILNTETNISFHKPKSDLCDKCVLWEVKEANGLMTPEDHAAKNKHKTSKDDTMQQRAADQANTNPNTLVIAYDLENVFALPRTAVSSAYYKCKLNTYNMTAIVGRTKKGYCSVWSEDRSGRSGNDIASAMISNLSRIADDHPEVTEFVLWSDSCVPQNRNSNMMYALQHFIDTHTRITSITHRFSEPGHSSIQDIDNLHSLIERNLKGMEIHSPITLVRHLKIMKCNGHNMNVKILDGDRNFFDYASCAKTGTYKRVPFSSVKEYHITSATIHTASYKTSFADHSSEVEVLQKRTLRNGTTKPLTNPKLMSATDKLSEKKVADLKSLLDFMSADDRIYMAALCERHAQPKSPTKRRGAESGNATVSAKKRK